jgi:8-oxo-dGTP diphosphatase
MNVIAVVRKGKSFLMVHNPNRGWEFPGGKVRVGEDCAAAALRELEEEAGVLGVIEKRLPDLSGLCIYLVKFAGWCCEGEFRAQFFMVLPDELSYPVKEAERILSFVP